MATKRPKAVRRADAQSAAARAAAIREQQQRQERRRRSLIVTAVAVVVLVIIGGVGYSLSSSHDTTGVAAKQVPSGTVGRYAVPAGPASAPVKIDVYEDFMCPVCGEYEAASRGQFAKDLAQGKVQFHYHVLNFLDRSSTTQYSTRAANALAVVLDTSGASVAKRFHDLLFEHQPQEGSAGLSDTQLVDFAVQAGAKRSAVEQDIKGLTFKQWVNNVNDRASKDHVTGTPTVRIGGKTVGWSSIGDLVSKVQKAIDAG
jgi:protein-disulfide isomerase